MRTNYKKSVETHVHAVNMHMGKVIDGVWEVIRICSFIIDECLLTGNVQKSLEKMSLLHILRNMISDCCCCMDALERGHDRTVFNNIRMVFEDFSCVVHAKSDPAVLEKLLEGKYQASKSISFLRDKYPTHEFHKTYGILSRLSHHARKGLIARQWVNESGIISHLKPFDPDRIMPKLDVLMMIIHLVRMGSEVAEELCFSELIQSYYWSDQKIKKKNVSVDILITDIANMADEIIEAHNFSPSVGENAKTGI